MKLLMLPLRQGSVYKIYFFTLNLVSEATLAITTACQLADTLFLQVSLPNIVAPSSRTIELFSESNSMAKNLQANIRNYNSAFAMASWNSIINIHPEVFKYNFFKLIN